MVYLYNAKSNTVEKHFIPIKKGVVSREHLDTKKEKEDRIDAFIKGLDTDYGSTLSFEKNMEKFLSNNKVKKPVKQILNKFI
jgi:hypothetical protein